MLKPLIENHLYLIEDEEQRLFGRYRGVHPSLGMHCFITGAGVVYYTHEKLDSITVRHQWERQRKSS